MSDNDITTITDDPAAGGAPATCGITICRHRTLNLTKVFQADGTVIPYGMGKHFDMVTYPLNGMRDIADMLEGMQGLPHYAVHRGGLVTSPMTNARRLIQPESAATLRDVPRSWVALDFDRVTVEGVDLRDLEACGRAAAEMMPEAFHGVRAIVHASASHLIKPGLNLHVWYWLSRPTTGAELKTWLGNTVIDTGIFGANAPIYCAAPIFEVPSHNRLPCRLAALPGSKTVVEVPPAAVLAPRKAKTADAPTPIPDAGQVYELIRTVAAAVDGGRNTTLFRCACRMGAAVAAGQVTLQWAFDSLVSAAINTGLDRTSVEATASSGLQRGQADFAESLDPHGRAQNVFAGEIRPTTGGEGRP